MPRRKCLYDVLGVPKTIDGAELKKVYRQLALKFHPDKNIEEPERAKRAFQEIQVKKPYITVLFLRRFYLPFLLSSQRGQFLIPIRSIEELITWPCNRIGWTPKPINISCTGGPIRTKIFSHGHKKPPNIPCNELLNWFILCVLPSICTHLDTSSGGNSQSVQATGNCPLEWGSLAQNGSLLRYFTRPYKVSCALEIVPKWQERRIEALMNGRS